MFTVEELKILNDLCQCPYNTNETYKDCEECEFHRKNIFCMVDWIDVKIIEMLDNHN